MWVGDIIKKLNKTEPQWVNDGWTPSGEAHIGALRGLVIHDFIYKELLAQKFRARFAFFINDFDPLDGLPGYLSEKEFNDQMGKPLFLVSAPKGSGAKSFSEYFTDSFIQTLGKINVAPEFIFDSVIYKKGELDSAIKTVLDNAEKIQQIYVRVAKSKKEKNWLPFAPICQNCGKLGTTHASKWDGKFVYYKCEENLVTWASGCGHEGKVSPFRGTGKMPWKVEWAAKWATYPITVEGAGKDHAASGGSRDVASAILREVFGKQPPANLAYEHFLLGGKKMSSSAGRGAQAKDMVELLPAELIRFQAARNPNRAVEFNPEGPTVPTLFDEFDKAREAHLGKIDFPDLAKTYILACDNKPLKTEYQMRFSKLVYLIQMPRVDITTKAEEEKGATLTTDEKKELERRITYAKKWLNAYAPEEFKFEVQKELPKVKLSKAQKEYLKKITSIIASKPKWQGEDLHHELHEIKNQMKINPKEAFRAIYEIFLGKPSGPQAGWFLASLDQKFAIDRLKESLK